MEIVIGITGASGAIYGIKILAALHKFKANTHLVITKAGEKTISLETDYNIKTIKNMAGVYYDPDNLGASISSGSFKTNGMIIAPCSIKSLSAIANSYNENLLLRAADVTLKEKRKLVLLVRETPLHLGHLNNMTQVAEMGGMIFPPIPAFYNKPQSIDDIVNHTVGRVLDQFNIENELFARWQGE